MASYTLTRSANEDLIDIWLYTREEWGEVQADRYQDELHRCCERIVAGTVRTRSVPEIDRSIASSLYRQIGLPEPGRP